MNIRRKIAEVSDLNAKQKEKMFSLMCMYYANTVREVFDHDLSEKKWVLMLLDEQVKDIVGFSTQMLFPFRHEGKDLQILFSGDTITQKEYWGTMGLSLLFFELMIKLLNEYQGQEIYWMLISKGLRTYKYLPAFYIEYYPCYDKQTPHVIQTLMHSLGEKKFPELYDKENGVVKAKQNGQYLKEEFHPKAKPTKKYEMFYYEANPGYSKGDDLLCLTRLSFDNINPFKKRLIIKNL